MVKPGMDRLIGTVFLLVSAVLLYYGWQSHAAIAPVLPISGTEAVPSRSIWMLAVGAVATVWGLYALLRRTAL